MGRFDGGEITSDAGDLLLREVEQRTRILGRLKECFPTIGTRIGSNTVSRR